MIRILLRVTIALFCANLSYAADVYKTVDENGNVTYSDKPTNAQSKKVELEEPIVVPRVIPKPRPATNPTKSTTSAPEKYQVTLAYPTPELHINPGTFNLSVLVSTDPSVHPDHKIVVLDNGEPIEGMTIEYIINGSHVIQARVEDGEGKVLGSSESVNVYVHRPTVNSRKNIEQR